MRGRKPKPRALRLIEGNRGKRPLPPPDVLPAGSIEKPAGLSARAATLWEQIIARAFWLTWADGPKARVWCELQAEFEQAPRDMISARIAQLRALGGELGLDPTARIRMQIGGDPKSKTDLAAKYFY